MAAKDFIRKIFSRKWQQKILFARFSAANSGERFYPQDCQPQMAAKDFIRKIFCRKQRQKILFARLSAANGGGQFDAQDSSTQTAGLTICHILAFS